ncbi:MAG: low temperature requirement protein A [Caldilineaceae bacterium]|nr:low temperature requirement protein A [Caldilineaceae bacterium]
MTQTVALMHDGITWTTVGQAVLVFWLVWWAWTQYTWALNAADTTHQLIQLGTLLATAIAFFMAVAVPGAFGDRALWFAVTYVLVRVLGLTLYIWVASLDPGQKVAVRGFATVSIGGLVAVLIGGYVGGSAQYWLWGAAILLDIVAAMVGGRSEGWDLHPDHFAERHGLFVIIALGETLIVAAGGVSGAEWTQTLFTLAVLAVALTCVLWWSYFPKAKPLLDRALEAAHGADLSMMARDVYSLLHFPMLCGVILYAASLEHAVSHLEDPFPLEGRVALGVSLLLFVGGMGLSLWRATGRAPLPRLLIGLVTALLVIMLGQVAAPVTLLISLAGIAALILVEARTITPAPDSEIKNLGTHG